MTVDFLIPGKLCVFRVRAVGGVSIRREKPPRVVDNMETIGSRERFNRE